MAIYDISNETLTPLEATTFANSDIKEREHLQQLLKRQIEVLSPNTLLISEEFSNWQDSRRRVDLLGVNREGNIVVIELKRNEDGGHMELQALRYAAMVSALTFDQAVDIYQDYLNGVDPDADARTNLLAFLDWESEEENDFAQDVQIVLAAAEFSKEITTTVLWLNNNGLDIRCVRLRPYRDQGRILVDIQQVIPLPEAEAYQIQMKQKNRMEQVARRQSRDLTKYSVSIGEERFENLPKRRAIFHVVRALFEQGVDPNDISAAISWRKNAIRALEGELTEDDVAIQLAEQQRAEGNKPSPKRWFIGADEIMPFEGKTYVLTKMWGRLTERALRDLCNAFPDSDIQYEPML